MRWYNNK